MAVISLMSAKGAPGTTTTTLLAASLWPAPSIVLDADPLGGDIGLRMQRSDGRAMDPERGLMSLIPQARRGLAPELVEQHAQEAVGGQLVLTGLPGPEQAVAIAPLWAGMADSFARIPDMDVFVDAGQVRAASSHVALVERSDVLLCVYRATAWSAVHTRRRLESLENTLRDHGVKVGIVGVASGEDEPQRQSAADAIAGGLDWVTDYGGVALDPRAVTMFEGVVLYRPERTMLARSGRVLATRVYSDLVASHAGSERLAAAALDHDARDDAGEPSEDESSPPRAGRRRAVRRLRESKEVS